MFALPIYLLFRAGIAFLALFPLGLLFALGELGGAIAWIILPGYRRLASRNVALAYGDNLTRSAARRLVRQHFRRLGANFFAGIKLSRMPVAQLKSLVTIENADAAYAAFERGPVVLVLSHVGNWELLAQLMPQIGREGRKATIYQQLRNPYIDAYLRKVRSRAGLELFDRAAGFKGVVELLREGGGVGILTDQHAGNHGVWTPFFGRLASTTWLPAMLAKRTGATLIPAAMYTNGRARWRLVFEPAIDVAAATSEETTARVNEAIERQVRRAPEDWFWVHDRWKTPVPNFLLTNYKRGVLVPPGAKLKPFRILVRSSNWLGDAVMSMPAVRALKRGRLDAHVTVVAPQKLAALWKRIAEVDDVIPLPDKSLFAATRAIKQRGGFDAAVLFPNSLRSALEARLAGIDTVLGFAGHRRTWLLSDVVRPGKKPRPPRHHRDLFLRIAQRAGANTTDAALPRVAAATRDGRTLLGLCPGAEYGPAKRWLSERFAEAAQRVCETSDAHWVIFGTAGDRGVADQIANSLGERCTNLAGETSLDELIDELARCRLLLTNDTGTMHLAALLRVPTVSIFGSTEPALTGPLGDNHIVIRHHVECSPCFLRECPIDFRCMHAVGVDEVVAAVLKQLA